MGQNNPHACLVPLAMLLVTTPQQAKSIETCVSQMPVTKIREKTMRPNSLLHLFDSRAKII